MGYDMSFVSKDPAEADRVAEIQKLFDAAVRERNALPEPDDFREAQLAHLTTGVLVTTDAAYAAAQSKVSRLYESLRRAEQSYFRLNIWGMGHYREAMHRLGMIYDSEPPDWPEPPGGDWDTPGGRATRALSDSEAWDATSDQWIRRGGETDAEWVTRSWASIYPDEPSPDESDLTAARAYIDETDRVRRAHPVGGVSIPMHKFCSNDGWVVTPDEALWALTEYHARSQEERDAALDATGIEDRRYWQSWLDYLMASTRHEGFEVW